MIIQNKIQQTFNGPLIFMGITFLVIAVGFVIATHWIVGILSFSVACFMLFTWSGIEINAENREIKPFYMLFGLIKSGKWISLNPYIGITLVPMKKVYSVLSRSNQVNSSVYENFRVYLVGKNKKPAIPLSSFKTANDAEKSINELKVLLNLPILNIKKRS